MIVVPQIPRIQGGESLNFKKINHIIKRIEYAAEIASQIEFEIEQALDINLCLAVTQWSVVDYFGFNVCPNVGPPCNPFGTPSCVNGQVSGVINSSITWPSYCLSLGFVPKCSYTAFFDDFGKIANLDFPAASGCQSRTGGGIIEASSGLQLINKPDNSFSMRISFEAKNGVQGGPYGFIGSGAFYLDNPND